MPGIWYGVWWLLNSQRDTTFRLDRALRSSGAGAPCHLARTPLGDELAWQAARLPDRLRDEIMSRIIVEPRKKGLFVKVCKGPDF